MQQKGKNGEVEGEKVRLNVEASNGNGKRSLMFAIVAASICFVAYFPCIQSIKVTSRDCALFYVGNYYRSNDKNKYCLLLPP